MEIVERFSQPIILVFSFSVSVIGMHFLWLFQAHRGLGSLLCLITRDLCIWRKHCDWHHQFYFRVSLHSRFNLYTASTPVPAQVEMIKWYIRSLWICAVGWCAADWTTSRQLVSFHQSPIHSTTIYVHLQKISQPNQLPCSVSTQLMWYVNRASRSEQQFI